jgi:putative sterol carrier protein
MLEDLTQQVSRKVEGKEAFGFNVKIDLGETGLIFIAGEASPVEVGNGDGAAAITFTMSANDLAAMLAGELSPMGAYTQGKMRVEGDIGKAMQIGSLFG